VNASQGLNSKRCASILADPGGSSTANPGAYNARPTATFATLGTLVARADGAERLGWWVKLLVRAFMLAA
jgi:hypothetical protein